MKNIWLGHVVWIRLSSKQIKSKGRYKQKQCRKILNKESKDILRKVFFWKYKIIFDQEKLSSLDGNSAILYLQLSIQICSVKFRLNFDRVWFSFFLYRTLLSLSFDAGRNNNLLLTELERAILGNIGSRLWQNGSSAAKSERTKTTKG